MEAPNKSESIQYPEIAVEITTMYDADQAMRKRWEEYNELPEWPEEPEEDKNLDERNTTRMKEIVEQIGWPTISKVGKKASGDAWLLVQHADKDIEFQRYCLELMKIEQAGEVALRDIAYLEDRVRINSGQPQLYGTQFRWTEDNKPIQDIEDRENVDQRRAKMGLRTLAEGMAEMYEKYPNLKTNP